MSPINIFYLELNNEKMSKLKFSDIHWNVINCLNTCPIICNVKNKSLIFNTLYTLTLTVDDIYNYL